MTLSCKPNPSAKEDREEEGFDGLLSAIGFGRWQIIILMSPIFAMAIYPVHLLGASFLNAPLPFRCFTGQPDIICESGSCKNQSSLYLSGNETYYNSQCLPSSLVDETTIQLINDSDLQGTQRRTSLASCPIIEYDTSVFTSTVVSEFDLVCEQSYMRPLFVTLGTIGNMFGSIFGGYIGDRWGRIRAVKLGTILNILVVAAMAVAPYYPVVLVTRFLTGCSLSATLVPAWSAGLESTPSRHRTLAGMFLGLPFSVCLMGYAGMAYVIRTWQYLLLAGASPVVLLLLASFMATESPRWLLQKGRLEEARTVLWSAVKLNGAKLDLPVDSYVDKIAMHLKEVTPSSDPENPTCRMSMLDTVRKGLAYFQSPAMRTIILSMAIIWILHNLLYLGVALNANNFSSDDPFMYVALTGAMDAAAILLIAPLTSCFGRRVIIMVGFIGSGTLFFLELAVPADLDWLRWVLVMSGFFLVAGSLQVNFLYAPEVFPTEIRARGFAFVQVLGGVGSSMAPFITDVLSLTSWWGPTVAFGCAGIFGGLLLPFLPETKDQPLIDTVEELEESRKKKKDKTQSLEGVENQAYASEDAVCHL